MKKKTLIVAVLAIALALSVVALAGAKYAGYAYNNPIVPAGGTQGVDSAPNPYPGYLSWSGATEIYNRNVPGGADMNTAHGNYVSSTTKCAVCHSAHRAYSAAATSTAVAPVNLSLTSAGGCTNCHTAWGAGAATKKIEWANLNLGLAGGPHNSFNCTSNCHNGGVHGTSNSAYNGMNAYMLGNDKDAAITTAFENGNVSNNITYVAGGGTGSGANWFQSGTSGTPTNMGTPSGVNNAQMAAAKAMATGYTCAKSGCHGASQFAVNTWGFSAMHASNPTNNTTLDMAMTGHGTGAFTDHTNANGGCGPCHPGNAAGGFRTAGPSITNLDNGLSNNLTRQYGCDQCHDMVGQATNTTAFPHGNRNIAVYQWDTAGAISTITVGSNNLWMYKGDVSAAAGSGAGQAIDKSFTVITDAASYNSTTKQIGNIQDGACLKCHIPIDSKSLASRGITNGTIYPAGRQHSSRYVNGVFTNSGSSWKIFLYK